MWGTAHKAEGVASAKALRWDCSGPGLKGDQYVQRWEGRVLNALFRGVKIEAWSRGEGLDVCQNCQDSMTGWEEQARELRVGCLCHQPSPRCEESRGS